MNPEENINSLTAKQEKAGEVICTIVRNYNKDGPSRKTIDYLKKIEDKTVQLWEEFDETDSILRDKYASQKDHPYFAKDYFELVRKAADTMLHDITRRIKEHESVQQGSVHDDNTPASLKETTKEKSNLPKITMEKSTDNPGLPLNNKSRFILLIEILKRAIKKINEDKIFDKGAQFCALKAKGLEKNWEAISDLYQKLDQELNGEEIQDYFYLQDHVDDTMLKLMANNKEKENAFESKPLNIMMKLPKIELPKFDGEYINWLQFHDLYKQMIHEQPIPPAQKLYFLRANVSGKAQELIQNFKPTDDNYELAWGVLVERFNNKRLLLTAQLNKLLTHPTTSATSASLRRLHDNTKECLQVIQNLSFDVASWDPIVVHLLLQKLDRESREKFEFSIKDPRSSPSVEEFLKFVESRFQTLEAINNQDEKKRSHYQDDTKKKSSMVIVPKVDKESTLVCYFCNSINHGIYNCNKFLSLAVPERGKIVGKLSLCKNCLRKGHISKSCTSSRRCQICKHPHNTLLHRQWVGKPANPEHPRLPVTTNASTNATTNAVTSAAVKNKIKHRHVYLATAMVNVMSSCGVLVPCRVLLDSGSQLHFITSAFLQQLGIRRFRKDISISGIGAQECSSNYVASITFKSRTSYYEASIEANVMSHISDYQCSQEIDISSFDLPSHIQLADPLFCKSNKIDMLLGAELFFELLLAGEHKISKELPTLRNTVLGWIIAGSASYSDSNKQFHCHIVSRPSLTSLDKLVRSFWESESHNIPVNTESEEEHQCEEHFKNNTSRNSEGKFVVKLPFKEDPTLALGESLQIARKRFLSLENKLNKNEELKQAYTSFMQEYESLGHMTPIQNNHIPKNHYVIPHHCVMKPESSSTKLRAVFDASAKTTNGHSLNDILMVGPTVQPDLFAIVLKFRMHRYVFTADITKMYRQILIHEDDRPFQLIFWRSQSNNSLQLYKLNTVTYGTASASYLATRCLIKLADDGEDKFFRASNAIKNNFYVDDCLTGSETIDDTQELLNEIVCLLKEGNFELKKFCSNNSMILKGIPEENKEKLVTFYQSEIIKTLGLIWDPSQDIFKFSFNDEKVNKITNQISKRQVLADLARLFDPLGLLGPIIVIGKLFLQEMWKSKLTWDEKLSAEKAQKWINYVNQFSNINQLSIPRYALLPCAKVLELHAFSDSSLSAFGACVYIKSINEFNKSFCQLLCSKSRIVPLKTISIARLELQAALLMVELVERLIQILPKKIERICYYTDSTTVLAWIKSPSYTWETFVANRVAKIQSLSEFKQWQYIKGHFNPADLVSRGVSLETLMKSPIWFDGPEFLREGKTSPYTTYEFPEAIPERRKNKSVLSASFQNNINMIEKINYKNSFLTLRKIFSFCFRFYHNCKTPKELRNTGQLTVEEVQEGTRWILAYTQRVSFPDDYLSLASRKLISKNSCLASLTPYFDERTKLIRVGGRLSHARIPPDAKHQILLPKNNVLTKLILTHLHFKHMHASHRALIAISRQQYWILGVGHATRKAIKQCIICFRAKPKFINQLMGNLPAERVNPTRPFHHTGVDFCGPIKIHYQIRGKNPTKSYLAVFVCFSTKAVHIEVVGDLSAHSFIYALKRFIGRRGLCHTIFCDNATNFVGAKNELAELTKIFNSNNIQTNIHTYCLEEGIKWKNIPPRSPHFGGLWEAAVKSAKALLVRHIGEASLTYEQLQTVVIQIEAILNSRPLTPLSSDPNDLEALTPGHFLIGSPLTALPEPDVTSFKLSNLNKFRQIQQIQQHFWKRWSQEYLHLLQQKLKWKTESQNLKPDTLVLLKEENIPPMRWKLGRVIETFKGSDNKIRVASIKTHSGIYQRAIHNLCPLPITDEQVEKDESNNKPVVHQTRSTRVRNPLSLISVLFLAMVIVPTILCQSNIENQIETKKIDDGIGIYFEDMGRIRTLNTNWKIFIYYNLTTYWQEFNELKIYVKKMQDIRTKDASNQIYYAPIIETLQNRIATIDHNNDLLNHYHSPKYEKTRIARSPFDIIGTLAHSLFGILDQESADEIQDQIQTAYKNEDHLIELLQKQSSIADATSNILKRDHIQVQEQFKALNDHLQKTTAIINEKQKTNELRQNFASLTSYLILVLTNFEHVQEMLLNILLDLNHQKINPQLITPKQFGEQLRIVRSHLPSYLSLPEGSVIDMYKLSSVKGRFLNNSIVFEMLLPLLDADEFQIFNLLSIPVIHMNKMYMVKTTAQFLAVSLPRDRYFMLNDQELGACKRLTSTKYMCNQVHPTYIQEQNSEVCEMTLLNHKDDIFKRCELNEIPIRNFWIGLKSNSWIYSIPSRTSGHLICGDKTNTLSLLGNGILEFKQTCILQLPNTIIKGKVNYESSITSSFIPSANASSWNLNIDQTSSTPDTAIKVNHVDPSEFDELKSKIKDVLDKSKALPHPTDLKLRDYHHYGSSAILLACMIGLLVIVYCRTRRPRSEPQIFEVNV